jgi:hypothetical protein
VILLDTTVLLYAIGGDHPLKRRCAAVFDAASAGAVAATTSASVIQEFAYARARRMGRADAAEHALRYADLLAPLVPVEQRHVEPALELFAAYAGLDAFDAFLAAAALSSGAFVLVSADRAFAEVPGLRYVDPATPELDAIIGT